MLVPQSKSGCPNWKSGSFFLDLGLCVDIYRYMYCFSTPVGDYKEKWWINTLIQGDILNLTVVYKSPAGIWGHWWWWPPSDAGSCPVLEIGALGLQSWWADEIFLKGFSALAALALLPELLHWLPALLVFFFKNKWALQHLPYSAGLGRATKRSLRSLKMSHPKASLVESWAAQPHQDDCCDIIPHFYPLH